MKIIDKVNNFLEEEKDNKRTYYSFEYFPPKTDLGKLNYRKAYQCKGVENLLDRIQRMSNMNPLWVDITWGAAGSTAELTLDLCKHI